MLFIMLLLHQCTLHTFVPVFQCIPTALAWFFHHLPQWFLKLSCVATYLIEIPIPLLFFSPVKSMRMFAFYSQVSIIIKIPNKDSYSETCLLKILGNNTCISETICLTYLFICYV